MTDEKTPTTPTTAAKPAAVSKEPEAPAEDGGENAAATAKKQAAMDKARAARTAPSPVIHTIDNALAGAGELADEKALARKKAAQGDKE